MQGCHGVLWIITVIGIIGVVAATSRITYNKRKRDRRGRGTSIRFQSRASVVLHLAKTPQNASTYPQILPIYTQYTPNMLQISPH